MKPIFRPLLAGVGTFLLLNLWSASAQIPVSGISDRGVYQNTAGFFITNEPGCTYFARLDGQRVPVGATVTLDQPDYHELWVTRTHTATQAVTNWLVRFILVTSERNCCETSLPTSIPHPTINSSSNEWVGGHLRIITPEIYPAGLDIPVVAWVENDQGHAIRANGLLLADGFPAVQLRRGVGSKLLPGASAPGALSYAPRLAGLQASSQITIESETTWTSVSGVLPNNVSWPENSRILVTGNLVVTNLTIGAGTVVRLWSLMNVDVYGQIVINGATNRPVVFTPASTAQPWGGFVLRTASARLTATGTIFTGSGADPCFFDSGSYRGVNCAPAGALHSHRPEQPLFHFPVSGAGIALTDCAAISLAGQFGYSVGSAALKLTRVLIQGCTTGGQYGGPGFDMTDSALIEVPVESPDFADGDNDGLYLNTGGNAFTNCLFGWTKDDALDTGGSGSGTNHVINCWFESTFHEGIAGSGNGKYVNLRDTVAINCGQGFEDGYDAMSNTLNHCLAIANLTGARFADNYVGGYVYNGFMRVTNSLLLYNYRNVWGMAFNPTGSGWQSNSWVQRFSQMDVRGNFLSQPDTNHPNNSLWDPARDGWRLAAFMSTPPDAPVGIGLAVWTNQFDLASLLKGVPVRLSGFTTNPVSVGYTFLNVNGTLSEGTLTFVPGETVKTIFPRGFEMAGQAEVRLLLGNPVNGELTGTSEVIFRGSVAPTQISWAASGRQGDLLRAADGVALTLNRASSIPVSIGYTVEGSGQTLAAGTLVFEPGQTAQWLTLPGMTQDYGLVRVSLNNPLGGTLAGTNEFYLVRTPLPAPQPPATTLLAKGAYWKYLDTGTNLGLAWSLSNPSGWTGPTFDDSLWPTGRAPLGYGYGGLERTTNSYGPSSTSKYITYYYRTSLVVSNVSNIASLTFNLLRDDGAVVYLNGAEVYRDNMPIGVLITNRTFSSSTVSGSTSTYYSTNVSVSNLAQPLQEGTNLLAVEVHQAAANSSDLVLDLEVLANPAPLPGQRPSLYAGKFSPDKMVLGWGDGTYALQGATNAAGPYSNLSAPSPVITNPTNAQTYFRLRK